MEKNMTAEFEIKCASNGQFFFIFKSAKGKTVVTSETYTTKQSCQSSMNALKKENPDAKVHDITK